MKLLVNEWLKPFVDDCGADVVVGACSVVVVAVGAAAVVVVVVVGAAVVVVVVVVAGVVSRIRLHLFVCLKW